jgi:hypothetical protein
MACVVWDNGVEKKMCVAKLCVQELRVTVMCDNDVWFCWACVCVQTMCDKIVCERYVCATDRAGTVGGWERTAEKQEPDA